MKKMKPPMMISGSSPVRTSPIHELSGAGLGSNVGCATPPFPAAVAMSCETWVRRFGIVTV